MSTPFAKRRPQFYLLALLLGCADTATPAVVDPFQAGLDNCGLLATMTIDSVHGPGAQCGGAMPAAGGTVTIEKSAGGNLQLRLGKVVLPGVSAHDCVYKFAGCQADAAYWASWAATLRATATGPQLTVQARHIANHTDEQCPADATYALQGKPLPASGSACAWEGDWQFSAEPKLSSGKCSYGLSGGQVHIAKDGGKTLLTWPGISQEFVLTINAASCTATGKPDFDLVLHNGVERTLSLSAQLAGGRLTGTLHDKLDGTSDAGETCDGAFSFASDAPGVATPTGATAAANKGAPLPAAVTPTCPSRPYACGDGVCEPTRGEGCKNCPGDCACLGGQDCLAPGGDPGVCRSLCNVMMDSCGDGLQCDSTGPMDGAGDKTFHCLPAGTVAEGGGCTRHRDCTKGQICWGDALMALPWETGKGVCAKRCETACNGKACWPNTLQGPSACPKACLLGDPGNCPPGAICYDKYAWYTSFGGMSDFVPLCLPEPPSPATLGASCDTWQAPCGDGLTCFKVNTGKVFCSKPCVESSTCGGLQCIEFTYSSGAKKKFCSP